MNKVKISQFSKNALRGFSLIELLVVVALMAILVAIGTVSYFGVLDKSKINTARTQAYEIAKGVEIYRLQSGSYPESLEDLVDSQVMEKLPLDPWQNPYNYAQPGTKNPTKFDVWSDGPANSEGGIEADIGNWEPAKK